MADWGLIQHFTESEFACPCCGAADMDQKFLHLLDRLRGRLGFALQVSSGFRCRAYNARRGFTQTHSTGKAADIAVSRVEAARLLLMLGSTAYDGVSVTGIGVKQTGQRRFMHVDCCEDGENGATRPMLWEYK